MANLKELKKSILADGVIDEQEVNDLRKVLFADGVIDKEEANFLFDLNNEVSGVKNHSSWKNLFVEAISSYLLNDEKSPGEIDEEEAKWLINKVQGDGRLDDLEEALLMNLKAKAKKIPQSVLNLLK